MKLNVPSILHRCVLSFWLLTLVLSPAMLSAATQSTVNADVGALKKIFGDNIAAIDTEFAGKLRAWPDEYLKELDGLQKKMQQAGDLDGWQAVNNEVLRFKGDKFIQPTVLSSPASLLQAIQKRFQLVSSGLEIEKSRKIQALADMYVARLTTMQKNLTVAGKIDDALVVNTEIKRVKALPVVSSAEFAIMVVEAEKGVAVAQVATAPVEEKKHEEPAADLSGATVYDGQTPPSIPGVFFKSVSMSGTDRLRVSKKVAVNVVVGKKSNTSVTASAGSHERSGSVESFIRVNVKASNVSYVFEGMKMAVQIFLKPASGKGGATEYCTDLVKLPKIENSKQVCVDLAPVVTSSSSYKNESGPKSTTGQEYYGLVVSVFDEAGVLVYQSASSDRLESMGIAIMPKGNRSRGIEAEFEK